MRGSAETEGSGEGDLGQIAGVIRSRRSQKSSLSLFSATDAYCCFVGGFPVVGSAIWIATRSRSGVTGFCKWSIVCNFDA